ALPARRQTLLGRRHEFPDDERHLLPGLRLRPRQTVQTGGVVTAHQRSDGVYSLRDGGEERGGAGGAVAARVAAGAVVGARLRDRRQRLRARLADAVERGAAERRQAVGRRRLPLERLLVAGDQALDLLPRERAHLLGGGQLAGELVLREL